MKEPKKLTTNAGAPVADNQNVMTAGPRGRRLLLPAVPLSILFDRNYEATRQRHLLTKLA